MPNLLMPNLLMTRLLLPSLSASILLMSGKAQLFVRSAEVFKAPTIGGLGAVQRLDRVTAK
jgi:hypothetical protein